MIFSCVTSYVYICKSSFEKNVLKKCLQLGMPNKDTCFHIPPVQLSCLGSPDCYMYHGPNFITQACHISFQGNFLGLGPLWSWWCKKSSCVVLHLLFFILYMYCLVIFNCLKEIGPGFSPINTLSINWQYLPRISVASNFCYMTSFILLILHFLMF